MHGPPPHQPHPHQPHPQPPSIAAPRWVVLVGVGLAVVFFGLVAISIALAPDQESPPKDQAVATSTPIAVGEPDPPGPTVVPAQAEPPCLDRAAAIKEARELHTLGSGLAHLRTAQAETGDAAVCATYMRQYLPRVQRLRACADQHVTDPLWTALRTGSMFLETCVTCTKGDAELSANWGCRSAQEDLAKLR